MKLKDINVILIMCVVSCGGEIRVEEKGEKKELLVSGRGSLKGYRNVKIFPFFALWGNSETEMDSSLKSTKPPQANVILGVKPAIYVKLPSGCRAVSDISLQVILSPNVRVGLLPQRGNDGAWSLACSKYKLSKSRRRLFPPCPQC